MIVKKRLNFAKIIFDEHLSLYFCFVEWAIYFLACKSLDILQGCQEVQTFEFRIMLADYFSPGQLIRIKKILDILQGCKGRGALLGRTLFAPIQRAYLLNGPNNLLLLLTF